MKALTLWQPWASLVALGEKKIETRGWTTKHRGELAIHSAAALPAKWLGKSAHTQPFRDELADVFNVRRDADDRDGVKVDSVIRLLPLGKILCIVNLTAIETTDRALTLIEEREHIFGNYDDGRYAWHLELIERFDVPIKAKGNRMLWNWERYQ